MTFILHYCFKLSRFITEELPKQPGVWLHIHSSTPLIHFRFTSSTSPHPLLANIIVMSSHFLSRQNSLFFVALYFTSSFSSSFPFCFFLFFYSPLFSFFLLFFRFFFFLLIHLLLYFFFNMSVVFLSICFLHTISRLKSLHRFVPCSLYTPSILLL